MPGEAPRQAGQVDSGRNGDSGIAAQAGGNAWRLRGVGSLLSHFHKRLLWTSAASSVLVKITRTVCLQPTIRSLSTFADGFIHPCVLDRPIRWNVQGICPDSGLSRLDRLDTQHRFVVLLAGSVHTIAG